MGLTNYSLKKDGSLVDPTSPDLTIGSGEGQGSHISSLDSLVEAVYNSVTYAQRKVETEHLSRVMSTYFDKEGNPVTFKVNLPGNNGEITETAVPLLTLSKNSHLSIKELEMELKVDLGHFGDKENSDLKKLSAKMSGPRKSDNLTTIKIVMKGTDPPEGLAKLNDQLIKILPD